MTQGQPLLEREVELEQLDGAISEALAGHGSLLVLEGPAGIGKTALLGEARRRAADRAMAVLAAQAAALEHDFGFGVVRQLFEARLLCASPDERARLLAGAAELAGPIVAPGHVEARGPVQQLGVVHGLFWLIANLSEAAPLLVAVDDVHWADTPSVAFLTYVARRLEGIPVLVVVALRTGDPQPDDSIVAELVSAESAQTVRPAALSIGAVASIVRDRLGAEDDPGFAAACHAATGGVPFLVRELVSALDADRVEPTTASAAHVGEIAPTTVAHATALRISRASAEAVAVARAIAILGPHSRVDRIATLADVDEAHVVAAEDALIAMEILTAGPPVGFVHPLVHRAVYDDIPAAQRGIHHARAAHMLAAEPAPLDEIAAHLLQSPPAGDAANVELLQAAASNASNRGAPTSAVAYLRRAVDEGASKPSPSELLYDLGIAETVVSHPRAISDLKSAFPLEQDPIMRGKIAYAIALLSNHLGEWSGAEEWIETAVLEVGDRDLDLAARFEAARASTEAYHPRTAGTYETRLPRLRRLLAEQVPGARNLALRLAAAMMNRWDDQSEVVPLALRGLDNGGFIRDEGSQSLDLPQGVVALLAHEQLDVVEAVAADMLDDARRRGAFVGFAAGSLFRGYASVQRGELGAAEADYRTGLELTVQNGWTFGVPSFLFLGVDVFLERPGLSDLAALAETTELAPDFAESANGGMLLAARGRLRLVRGRRDEAVADLRAAGAVLGPARLRNPIVWLWRSPLALALRPDEHAEARELVEEELGLARAMDLVRGEGVALRALGLLEGGERGLELLEQSLCTFEACPSTLERARSTVEIGAALRRLDHRAASRDRLREGLELAQRSGAQRLEDRALEELRVAGGRPRRRDMSGLESLTPSELRVARLAADGMANREIAQDLFVTTKTVENQLGHVYRKLGVRRDGLAVALAGTAT